MTKIAFGILILLLALSESLMLAPAEEVPSTENPEAGSADGALIVKKISFEGVKNTPEDFFAIYIQTKVGEEISPDRLSKDIKNLYKNTGFFSDFGDAGESPIKVEVETAEGGGLEVTYKLIESPKIESVKIIGNEKLKTSKIQDAITLKPSEIYSDQRRWESTQAILKAYKQKGYYLATIKIDTNVDRDTNTIEVTFEISEGERIKIREINFIGNDRISAKTLSKKIKTRVDKNFDESLLDQDLTLLRHYYQDQGYAQIEVKGYKHRLTADNTGMIIDISVDEGPEYIIGAYDIRILHSKKPAFSEDKIRDMLNPVEGEIFDRGTFQESIEKVQKAYQGKGFLLAEMSPTPDFDETTGVVDIALNVNEGDVIIIENVEIDGLEKTKENVIQRELDEANLKTGEFLDVKSLRKARQKLFQMGPFIRNIDIKPTPNASGENSRDLKVDITETPSTGMFSLGGGYGTEGGIYGVAEVGENNLFGRAYRVHLKGELGTSDRHTAELRFNTPWIFGSPTRLNASLYNTRRLHRFDSQYYQDRGLDQSIFTRKGGAVTVGRSVAQDIDVSIRFKNEYTHDNRGNPLFNIGLGNRASLNGLNDRIFPDELSAAFENNGDPLSDDATISVETQSHEWLIEDFGDDANAKRQYVIQPDGETSNLNVYRFGQHPYNRSVRSLTFFLSRDTRDYLTSIYEPVSGSLNTVSYEYAGGFLKADSKFQRYTLDSSWFTNTWSNHVIAAHARGGYLESRASDDWFLHYERFRLGGIDTIRGYNENQIGPARENGYGGNKVLFANFEYRIPLGSQLTGVAFFDVGQVWDELEPNVFENINLKKGAGVGIRFNLFGMLARLEWGYGFDRQRGQFHWTIGPGF
jgi:outer membrane protein assembly complex protein YaeT